ncbi:AIPR family protein [Priestia sp. RMT2NF4]|uniref:AIPR family protein n=1 Tax=Priestia sp. RMT2NF4 TaxID=3398394 RepID=UPI003A4C7DAF
MTEYTNSIEEYINLYLDAKEYQSVEYNEKKNFYYERDSKNLFIYDVFEAENIEGFGSFIEHQSLTELNGIEFDSIEFLILVKSVKEKYSIRDNPMFKKKLSFIKSTIARYLVNKTARNIEVNYEFIEDSSHRVNSNEIRIKERYRATEANPLSNPETNGIAFTANLFDIVNLYNKIGHSLFSENLRIGLGKKDDLLDVTSEILETLNKNPEEFWFLNNGITIIAEENTLNLNSNNVLQFQNLYSDIDKKWNISVINGAQTISAASKFFFENYEEKDKKILDDLLKTPDKLTKFVKDFVDEYPTQLEGISEDLRRTLTSALKSNKKNSIENLTADFKVCLNNHLETTLEKDDMELIAKRFSEKILPNQMRVQKAEDKADVLLRIIYYKSTSKSQVSEITSKITVALNRQKPMRVEDIALASQFVQNINDYYALEMKDRFLIIRRGEIESIDFKRYSLESVMRMLIIISNKNPGKLGNTSLSNLLKETAKEDSLIVFKDTKLFKDVFNNKTILNKDIDTESDDNPIYCPQKVEKCFNENYSFINSAIKMNYIINSHLKIIKKQALNTAVITQFINYHNSLGNNFCVDDELDKIDLKSLKAIVTYGSDYILACWFYQCWKYTLSDEQDITNFANSIIKSDINFSEIDYSNSIFKGEFMVHENESTEEKEANYKQLFCKFLIRLSNRWGKSLKIEKSKDKYSKNGFKDGNSDQFINEFLENDLLINPTISHLLNESTKPKELVGVSGGSSESFNGSFDKLLFPS